MTLGKRLFLIDGSAMFHRAYHAIRGLATSKGLPTNATWGFTATVRKLIADEQPDFVGVCMDPPGPTFRHAEYSDYKANRPAMEDDLVVQLPYIRRACEVLSLPILELAGFEADDVIATLALRASAQGLRVVVVSPDKDLLQLVSDDIVVWNPGREGSGGTLFDRRITEEKFGAPPERVVDVLALMGDAVDNVPGVAGIGEKGARDLVREFGPLEAILDNVDKIKRASYREGLKAHRDEAVLSKRLVTLRSDVPIDLDLEALGRRTVDREAAHALFSELEFAGLAREYAPEVAPTRTEVAILTTAKDIQALVAEAQQAGAIALSVVAAGGPPLEAALLGLAVAVRPGLASYIPLGHPPLEVQDALPAPQALELLKPILEDPAVAKRSARGKRDRLLLERRGIEEHGLDFDVVLAAYLLNPGRRASGIAELASEMLGEAASSAEGFSTQYAPLAAASQAAAEEASAVLRLVPKLRSRLAADGLSALFETMELPLVQVLGDMELVGVKVDTDMLTAMSRDLETQLASLTREIHTLAKGEFNVNSPVQLREVLFERLGLKSAKKTAKTREASTAEEVLEELALLHELPRKVLDYRALQKLKSTYVDALPVLVNPRTRRIHASFNQTVAATGRISSSDPNLQNIPIRSADGRRIREAFVAPPDHLLLSADYSQIELRILAHLSQDQTLIETFRRGEDVHDRTSREIFGPFSMVPPDEQRRRSKMINYALLYGKTAFTLAHDLGVTRKDAEAFIEAYFGRYPGVKRFLSETVEKARDTGVVRTLLGRLRRLPEIHSKNFQVRAEAERQAVNMPVQGSAADLIKKAMVDLSAALRERRLSSRLILQIHDELLLEVPTSEAEAALALVKDVMENALSLDVPLEVDARLGPNWAAVH